MTSTIPSISRLLLGVALAGASGLALSAGDANAMTVCSIGGAAGTPCTIGAPEAITDKVFTFLKLPTAGPGSIEIQYDPLALLPGATLPGIHTVDVDFAPDLNGPIVNNTFDYQIHITDPAKTFDIIGLSWNDLNTANVSVQKEIFQDSSFSLASRILDLTTNGGTGDIGDLFLQNIWVRETYNVPSGSLLENVTNSYSQQVPGPLPLLGAGTAFGFSRRLRRRCKQRHSMD
jgi:hypothetical protein